MSEQLPTFAPKLIALDIDGTLVNWVEGLGQFQETISRPVREAVQAAQAAGAHVVLASGRSAEAMEPIARALGLSRNAQIALVDRGLKRLRDLSGSAPAGDPRGDLRCPRRGVRRTLSSP
ncbi:MAG: HAD hydrolase family protein [Marmoricola sp.]